MLERVGISGMVGAFRRLFISLSETYGIHCEILVIA
jgi:hypothetical protein